MNIEIIDISSGPVLMLRPRVVSHKATCRVGACPTHRSGQYAETRLSKAKRRLCLASVAADKHFSNGASLNGVEPGLTHPFVELNNIELMELFTGTNDRVALARRRWVMHALSTPILRIRYPIQIVANP